MSLQFIMGGSGSGKSYYVYEKIIKESMENPNTNYILLVPEQYSMALQRKMVMMNPTGGTFNIDVIGFNRLAYRIFDELNVKPAKVLMDFGKSMLIRQVAGKIKNDLKVFGGSLNKLSFIDEVKSLMSEMYQYGIDRNQLHDTIEQLSGNEKEEFLYNKLSDIELIMRVFEDKLQEEYIVAEQLTELLAEYVEKSELIKRSVIILDGFTGFTPIQNNLIEKLMKNAIKMYSLITIDKLFYEKKRVEPFELFYLSRKTIDSLKDIANKTNTIIEADIILENNETATGRWKNSKDLQHLENNLFRYPYKKYEEVPNNIYINAYDTPRIELEQIARNIRKQVVSGEYRYKDFAIITGNLEGCITHVNQVFPMFNIPYFLDYNRPLKNNIYVDAIEHLFNLVKDNFSYDSVFSFIKSGIIVDLSDEEIENLENYVLERGIRGYRMWNRKWKDEVEDTRSYCMDILNPIYERIKDKSEALCVGDYVAVIRDYMDKMNYEIRMEDCIRIYDKLQELFDKMLEIMGAEEVKIEEFVELMKVGFKELKLGMIPSSLDSVLIGDITRTRLDEIKVLYIIDVNDGIIPKKGNQTQIIGEKDKEKLENMGMTLAPTDKMNSYIEQFYLYLNMTKPSEKLHLSYTCLSNSNEQMRPSYIIGRVINIFPELKICMDSESDMYDTKETGIYTLIKGIKELLDGNMTNKDKTLSLYAMYINNGNTDVINKIARAMKYNNIPEKLAKDIVDLVETKMLSQSISRLEQFANCAYAYFLKYTIGLKERKIHQFDNRNIGNILHSAMEKIYRHVHDNLNNDWESIDEATLNDMMTGFVNESFNKEYVRQDEDEFIVEGKDRYLLEMLIRIGKRTAKNLKRLTAEDSLKPEYFEYNFSEPFKIDDEVKVVNIKGVIDRGDIFVSESGDIRLRIIDYKSGNHEFKISKLYDGLQLQLAVYMGIMMELVAENNAKGGTLSNVIPEGMYYYHMSDPFIEEGGKQDLETKREKELKLKGLKNSDEEYFCDVIDFAKLKSIQIAESILEGNIDKAPMVNDLGSACDYCTYKSVCRFDDKGSNNKYRYPSYKETDKDKIYEQIKLSLEED